MSQLAATLPPGVAPSAQARPGKDECSTSPGRRNRPAWPGLARRWALAGRPSSWHNVLDLRRSDAFRLIHRVIEIGWSDSDFRQSLDDRGDPPRHATRGTRRGVPTVRKTSKVVQGREMAAFLVIFAGLSVIAGGQEVGKTQSPPPFDGAVGIRANDESIDAIDEDYAPQVLVLERRRLERLDRLASGQNPPGAPARYEKLFRLAMAANLFGEAEKPAAKVIVAGSPSRVTLGLAHAIKIVAEIDRGDYEASLESLRKAAADREKAVRG